MSRARTPKLIGQPPPPLPEQEPIGEALPASALPTFDPQPEGSEQADSGAADPLDPRSVGAVDPDFADPELHAEHEAQLAEQEAEHQRRAAEAKPDSRAFGQVPGWAKIPQVGADGSPFRFPRGYKILFVRFRAHLTAVPGKGERQAILWSLGPEDFRLAVSRGMGDAHRVSDEIAKQCIRAIDGVAVDWATGGVQNNPDQFWRDVGQAYRTQLVRLANQVNSLDAKELRDFLEHCVGLVIPG